MALSVVLLISALILQMADADDVRLVGGASRCDGELQVKHLDKWRDARFRNFVQAGAAAVCHRLDCGSAVSNEQREVSSRSVVELSASCVQSNSPMSQCVIKDNVSSIYHNSITCSESVRLLHGPRMCSGSLEVYWNQSWTFVCEEDFDLQDAEVICRELGCGAPSLLKGVLYREEFASLGQMFDCKGNESALMDCPRSSSAGKSCASRKAVVLTCSEPVRLVGGSSGCAGTVELRHRGQWRPLFVHPDAPPAVSAAVCPLLDCGSPVSAEITYFFLKKPVWSISAPCVQAWSVLRECVFAADLTEISALEVKCSGKPNHLLLLWLIPAVTVIITAVSLPIFCKNRKTSYAQRTTGRSQSSNPEIEIYETISVCEDPNYQSLSPDIMDQDQYIELRLQPCN